MTEKCPFCNSNVERTDSVCPACQSPLDVECPYCKQTIKAYDKTCPYCTTVLVKSDYSKPLFILGTVLSISWCIGNILILALFSYYPQVFSTSNKTSYREEFWVADYERLCAYGLIVPFVLFIILAVGKSKFRNGAIAGLIVNAALFVAFSIYALYLKFNFT